MPGKYHPDDAWRAAVFRETEKALQFGYYCVGEDQDFISLPSPSSALSDIFCGPPSRDTPQDPGLSPKVYVAQNDCLEVAESLVKRGLKTAVLNFANAFHAGGGYRNGRRAQEETLFRRTNLFHFLVQSPSIPDPYRIPDFGCIYSPNVHVFRKSEKDKYLFMENPFSIDIISAAADDRPPIKRSLSGDVFLTDEAMNRLEKKVISVLSTPLEYKVDALVLGAWGCGAFRNPPESVARVFQKCLREGFGRGYKEIVFAIIPSPGDSKGSTHDIFTQILSEQQPVAASEVALKSRH